MHSSYRSWLPEKGVFSALLSEACKAGTCPGEEELWFTCRPGQKTWAAVLEAIQAEKVYDEYMMELSLEGFMFPRTAPSFPVTLFLPDGKRNHGLRLFLLISRCLPRKAPPFRIPAAPSLLMYPVSYPPKGEGISLSSGHRGALQEPGTRRRLFNESLFPSGRTRLYRCQPSGFR